MPKLENRKQHEENPKQSATYYELITFYNKLDSRQREEFRHYLEKMTGKNIITSQIENFLPSLSQDNYQELIVQAKLMLVS